jgi:hypothetical protein
MGGKISGVERGPGKKKGERRQRTAQQQRTIK